MTKRRMDFLAEGQNVRGVQFEVSLLFGAYELELGA